MFIDQLLQYLPQNPFFYSISILGLLGVVSLIAFWITEKIIIKLLIRMFKKTSTQIDDILM